MVKIQHFFDANTWTLTYVVSDPATKDAVVIDPVLDYEPVGSKTSTESLSKVTAYLEENSLRLCAILETHAHADHLSGAQSLKEKYGAPVVIGEQITVVQETFKQVFALPEETPTDGRQFDQLFAAGEERAFGSLTVRALATPGHTPACLSYLVEDNVFTGDALFMEDYGTGRTDFPAGSPSDLYQSVHEGLYNLPDDTKVFVGHDYQPDGRALAFESTIGKQKSENVQLSEKTEKDAFVTFRANRDAGLRAPALLFQSVQVNAFGGFLPKEEENGERYFRLPVNLGQTTNDVGLPS